MESGLTKNKILSELIKSPHGRLSDYISIGQQAARNESEFFAHLISWNRNHGQIRDAKVALPVVSLTVPMDEEFTENALAHLALLGPRELLRAYRFILEVRPSGKMLKVRRLIEAYLHEKENDRNRNHVLVQHRKVMKELYALAHVKPNEYFDKILFKGEKPSGSVFEVISKLKDMSASEAASEIVNRKIPFLIALGALGNRAKDVDLVLALIQRMSPTELVTNTKMLEKLGVKTNPALRGAFEQALAKAATSKANILKTTQAVENIEDEGLKDKLRGLQDKQLKSMGPSGNWLVLADKSGSMSSSIEVSKHVSAALAKVVKGKVWLIFFDTSPMTIDVTGCSLDMIRKSTQHIRDGGGTSIGCGLDRMLQSNIEVDGIAIVSDGGENNAPLFPQVYQKYCEKFSKEPPVYLFQCRGDSPALIYSMQRSGLDMQVFDITGGVDFYSIPNLIQGLRENKYSLIDEVMSTKLLTVAEVLKTERKEVAHA